MTASIAHDIAGWIGAPTALVVVALLALRIFLMRRRRQRRRAATRPAVETGAQTTAVQPTVRNDRHPAPAEEP